MTIDPFDLPEDAQADSEDQVWASEGFDDSDSEIPTEPLVELNRGELLAAIRRDCVSFFSFYLQDELSMEVPDLHVEIWDEILEMVETMNQKGLHTRLKKLFGVPREHAKSTIAKLAVILLTRYTKLSFVLYVSKIVGGAANALRDIRVWLDSPQERQLYGKPEVIKSSETESLWIMQIWVGVTPTNPGYKKTVILKAAGSLATVRGMLVNNRRPQIVVIDDIEDQDNTTPELQKKLDNWFFGTLLKAFDHRHYICIFIGNMINSTTLLARLSKEPEWNPTVFGCIVKNKQTGALESLWPERNPLDELIKEYQTYRRLGQGHTWEAEMMNLTQDAIFRLDISNAIRIAPPLHEWLTDGFLCLDPAFGKTGVHDESAITVHAHIDSKWCDADIPYIVDSWHGRVGEHELFLRMLDISYRWGITTWAIESVAAQSLLFPLFRMYFEQQLISLDQFLLIPITGGHNSKVSRIQAFKGSVGARTYGVVDTQMELMNLLEQFSPVGKAPDHDDLIDSASLGSTVWHKHSGSIKQRGILKEAMRVGEAPMPLPSTGLAVGSL